MARLNRSALIPTAAGLVGGGLGLVLTRKPNGGRAGELADDLMGKVEDFVGIARQGRSTNSTTSNTTGHMSGAELAKRRSLREEHRRARRR